MKELEELTKMQAIAGCTKVDGAQFRDTFFVLAPGYAKEQPLAPQFAHTLIACHPCLLLCLAAGEIGVAGSEPPPC
jgi:hypothetical protein